jgi:hypothetical protein
VAPHRGFSAPIPRVVHPPNRRGRVGLFGFAFSSVIDLIFYFTITYEKRVGFVLAVSISRSQSTLQRVGLTRPVGTASDLSGIQPAFSLRQHSITRLVGSPWRSRLGASGDNGRLTRQRSARRWRGSPRRPRRPRSARGRRRVIHQRTAPGSAGEAYRHGCRMSDDPAVLRVPDSSASRTVLAGLARVSDQDVSSIARIPARLASGR